MLKKFIKPTQKINISKHYLKVIFKQAFFTLLYKHTFQISSELHKLVFLPNDFCWELKSVCNNRVFDSIFKKETKISSRWRIQVKKRDMC